MASSPDPGWIHGRGPVHDDPGRAMWHRGNGGEAIPGVSTPLNADFWRAAMEVALLRTFFRLGAISRAERGDESGAGSPFAGRICRFFYGRLASDFDIVLEIYGRLPGVDPDVIEEQMLGVVRGVERPRVSVTRRALAGVKTAATIAWIPFAVPARSRATSRWWRTTTTALEHADAAGAVAVFDEARRRMRHDLGLQVTVGSLQPGFVDQLGRAANTVAGEETGTALLSGVSGIEEAGMLGSLWAVARTDTPLASFLERYGYYAPDEGELSTRSWREDPAALDSVVSAYRSMRDDESPTNRFAARVKSFEDAKRQALRTAKPVARLRLRVLLRLARRYTELREQGKTLMLQCLDVARAAGRVLGRELARAGTIDDADDVFFLTLAEIEDALTTERNLRELVADRRRLHHAYQGITLPLAFRGEDLETIVDGHRTAGPAPTAPAVDAVEGLGVSPGTAVGVARVITDPLECADFEPGHVLVCTTTDPGWAPLLSLAAGVVLDMGSMLSHGAIVARELGVPCVANTTDGTRTIPDGALVEVDGTNGVVRVLEHLPQPATGGAA